MAHPFRIAAFQKAAPKAGILACLAAVGLLWSAPAAGQFNQVLSIGDQAPAWKDLPGTDGRRHALADLPEDRLVVIVFTCNSCGYSVDYEDRINRLAREHAGPEGKLALVAINCNLGEEDRLPAMRQRAEQRGFVFPYLFDESQQIARDYGAIRTPEFFLLDRARRVVYMGAMDDHSNPERVRQTYLADAVAAVLAGEEIDPAATPPVGCAIRWAGRRDRNR